ncbi:MAG: cyclic nucleotide-binding domain-containing protein [Thermosynechococcaceae cyanobacterium MS004]|nr:cyclic nucleotide-binding domain-containing protein [Thermosynechococcaceae cyanobacterium MS004]
MLSPSRTVEIFQLEPGPQLFSEGETIFAEGEKGEVMYGILEGEVNLIVNHHVVETILTGDVFGEGALVDLEHLRASTAIAKTDCKLVVLNQERFLFVIEQTPEFAVNVMRSMSNRLRHFKHLSD